MKKETFNLTQGGLIAALYVVLTFVAQIVGLASGSIQFRVSEALTILPVFTASAIPGLTIGCLVSNILTGCALWDVIIGTFATFLGAIGTYYIGRKNVYLGPVFPIVSNVILVPPVLRYVYGVEGTIPYFMVTVGIGEVVCCGVLGLVLYKILKGKINWDSSLNK